MDLRNLPLSGSMELFSKKTVEKTIKKFSLVVHNEAIRKAVSGEKPARKATKRLHFSQSSRPQQFTKRPSL